MMPTLVYCAAGNRRYLEIAVAAGYRYGGRLPHTVYPDIAPLWFADQEWRKPDRGRYLAALATHRPVQATVLDLERSDQVAEVLAWAEAAAAYVERVLIIPKARGVIADLPRQIGGKPVVLAYSVPTTYGGTPIHPEQFAGWPIHILGGAPEWQMRLWRYWRAWDADAGTATPVVSADGNIAQSMARRCQFWISEPARGYRNARWPQLRETDGWQGEGAPYEAFRRSCINIMAAWQALGARDSAEVSGTLGLVPSAQRWEGAA